MWEFFVKKDVQYNLHTKELCKLPSVSSQRYRLNSLSFIGNLLCDIIDDEMKLSPSLRNLKGKYVAGMAVAGMAVAGMAVAGMAVAGMAVAGMAVAVHVSFAINLVLFIWAYSWN